MEWVGYVDEVFAVLFSIMATAAVICNLTPTPKDDKWVGKVYKVIEALAGIWTRTAKQLPGEREEDLYEEGYKAGVEDATKKEKETK